MAMALIIFTGTGMEAKAAEDWYFEEYTKPNDSSIEDQWNSGILSEEPADWDSIKDLIKDEIADAKYQTGDVFIVYCKQEIGDKSGKNEYSYKYTKKGTKIGSYGDNIWGETTFWNIKSYCSTASKVYILKRGTAPAASDSGADGTSSAPHVHSYSWVTVQDVSSEQDGIEEYRCSCGDVQERCVIPRYMAIVKGLFGEIKEAPQNGTATFDSGRLYTISDYVIKKLAERSDVTTVITFEYQNRSYKMTIPAGADFTGLLADEEYFYGYFFFANAVGATIEAI